ncbi:hypothetical protein DSM3645_19937 [Blastopirellula marina DSM 3645]|uniref:Uncharacterized protein n=1 Tax=Blastopirellula marina DSM 3645 TaxID=314230 RepID=A4A176_9BACT|nr:hypothetical protein DSM3645_19937 [Blastopirellula marina DSM 3645]
MAPVLERRDSLVRLEVMGTKRPTLAESSV